MARSERLMVQITSDLRAEIEKAAAEQRLSLAAVIRQALLDWATRRVTKRAKHD